MRQAYRIRPDDANYQNWCWIEACHSLGLPGLRCAICGVRSTTGVQYPCVEPAKLAKLVDVLSDRWPVEPEEYKRRVEKVRSIVGSDYPLEPGTCLGPLRGEQRESGATGDFSWPTPWTPLLRESVWMAARESGIDLRGARADITFSDPPDHEPLIEFEAIPRVRVHSEKEVIPCAICGRIGMKVPDHLVIDGNTFDDSIPLQRIFELPTVLIVNEAFAIFIKERSLSDVVLIPIEIR